MIASKSAAYSAVLFHWDQGHFQICRLPCGTRFRRQTHQGTTQLLSLETDETMAAANLFKFD